jgi:hypothetical protein
MATIKIITIKGSSIFYNDKNHKKDADYFIVKEKSKQTHRYKYLDDAILGLNPEPTNIQLKKYIELAQKYDNVSTKRFKGILSYKKLIGMKAPAKKKTKKQGVGSSKKTIRKHRGINQRTGKLKKGFKYGTNGRIVEVQTPAQKKRQTGRTNVLADKGKQAKRPGKRISATGNVYYERRANRSDKGKLLAPDGQNIGDLCVRPNKDGSRTYYSSHGGNRPCPYGGRPATKSVNFLESAPATYGLNGKRKKKPTAKQLEAQKKFKINSAKARKLVDSGQAKNLKEAWKKI